jgi:hypothetical protein
VEVVSSADESCGDVQDGLLSGVTWVLFGLVHSRKEGTNGTNIGEPPPGRG